MTLYRPTLMQAGNRNSTFEGYVKTSTSKVMIQGTYEIDEIDGTIVSVFHGKREMPKNFAELTIIYTKGKKKKYLKLINNFF